MIYKDESSLEKTDLIENYYGFENGISGKDLYNTGIKQAKNLGVEEKNVSYLQYRGNGWPSGIQIKTKDGKDYFIKNNDSMWMEIVHSRLFIQPRCCGCRNTLNDFADIVLADPWLPEYVKTEKEGQTLFATHTGIGEELVSSALQNRYIEAL